MRGRAAPDHSKDEGEGLPEDSILPSGLVARGPGKQSVTEQQGSASK